MFPWVLIICFYKKQFCCSAPNKFTEHVVNTGDLAFDTKRDAFCWHAGISTFHARSLLSKRLILSCLPILLKVPLYCRLYRQQREWNSTPHFILYVGTRILPAVETVFFFVLCIYVVSFFCSLTFLCLHAPGVVLPSARCYADHYVLQ